MAVSGRFVRVVFVTLALLHLSGTRAQVLPLINEFSGMTFNGTVQVSWPVLYRNCTFRTDSILMSRSYGAVLVGCDIECTNSTLYLTGSGSGVVMQDCRISGCEQIVPALNMSMTERTYISGLTLNGHEFTAQEDQEDLIDIDGLEMADAVQAITGGGKTDSPLIMVMTADDRQLKYGGSTMLSVRGLTEGMFVGWYTADTLLMLKVDEDPMKCRVSVNRPVIEDHDAIVSVYTEYGLEAAVKISIESDAPVVEIKSEQVQENRKKRKNRKR